MYFVFYFDWTWMRDVQNQEACLKRRGLQTWGLNYEDTNYSLAPLNKNNVKV